MEENISIDESCCCVPLLLGNFLLLVNKVFDIRKYKGVGGVGAGKCPSVYLLHSEEQGR